MTKETGDENFLRRWSRRKVEEAVPEKNDAETLLPADNVPVDSGPVEAAVDGETEDVTADLPDIETLDKDSDYTGFLRDGVPEELKRMALRKLWVSDPVLANLDGLNDYDDDFAAIMKSGAEYMQRLADAGEKYTRPGADVADDEEAAEEEVAETVAEIDEPATGPVEPDRIAAADDTVAPDGAGDLSESGGLKTSRDEPSDHS